MLFKDSPIQRKLMAAMLLTSGVVLLLTCASFIIYEVITLRKGMAAGYATRAQIISANSAAALAFQNEADAAEVLGALKTDPRTVQACLYDDKGKLFTKYPLEAPNGVFPAGPGESRYRGSYLETFCPVVQNGRTLGVVFIRSNLSALTDRYRDYAWLAAAIFIGSLLAAFLLARVLQKQISIPVLALAETARVISNNRDFSVRAEKFGEDELGSLTDAFNRMLAEIQMGEKAVKASEERFRAMIENSADGIAVSDADGKATYASPALTRMLGVTAEELIEKPRKDLVHPEDLAYVMEKMAETVKNPGVIVQARYRLKHKDGSWRWIDMTATNLLENPAVRGIVRNIRDVTDKLKLEEIARLGEAQAIESIKDYSIIMLDPKGKILTWNSGAERIKGYQASEIVGKFFSIFYTPEDVKRGYPGKFLETASREGRIEEEGWRVRKDGSRFLADVIITALKNEKDELRGFIKVTRDVTEIKRAQRELAEKTELLDSVLENLGDGVVVADEKGKFLIFNKAAEKIIGLGAVDAPSNEWTKKYGVFLPDQVTPFLEKDLPLVRAIYGEDTHEVEQFLKNANHPEGVSILASGRPIKDPEGRIRGGVVIVRDITEKKKAEQQVKRANDFLSVVLENIPNMIFVKDAKNLRFVMFNKAGEELLGVPRKDLIGKNDYDLFSKADADFFTSKDRKTLEERKLVDIPEEPLQTKHQGERILHTKKIPVMDSAGSPQFLLGISEDITEQKRQESLKVYAKALETSNQELQDFVFVASHDLQEPLRKIQSFGEFLKDEFKEVLGDTGRDYVERMRGAASRMQILINDLLALTRVTTKAQPFVTVNLAEVIRGVLSDLETRIKEKNAKVEVGPLPALEADATQMRQLFQNLIGNALKFQKPGVPPLVTIKAETIQSGGRSSEGRCVIQVEDNGIGFDNKYGDQIFKVFERLHGRDEYEGTGIGLAICRKVVERHGGTIRGEGMPGKGSVFIIELPLQPKG